MKYVISLAVVVGFAVRVNAQDNASADTPLKFIFFADTRPVLLELHAEIDGKPVRTAWSDYLRRWFDLLDRDRDGTLNSNEVKNAPLDDLMLQTMRQGFFFARVGGPAPRMPADGDRITFDHFLRYYESKAGPYQFGNALQFSNANSMLLHQALDVNKDKSLTKAEIARAADLLDALDKSDDEVLTLDELAASTPGNFYGNQPVIINRGVPLPSSGSDSLLHINDSTTGKMALLLLTQYDRDTDKALQADESGLDAKSFALVDGNRDGKLDVDELARFHQRPADARLLARIGSLGEKQTRAAAENSKLDIREADNGLLASIGDAQVTLKVEPENPQMMTSSRNQFFLQQFRQIDKNNQKFIEKKNLQNNQFALINQIFALTDGNDDGKMTEEELASFLKLQDSGKDSFVTIGIVEQGRAFFQILDGNRDNRLSLRELRTAWSRLEPFDANKDGIIGGNEVARQFQVSISRGQNLGYYQARLVNPTGAPNRPEVPRTGAPLWFTKMDQNNDGDVSPREFLGSREQFLRLDADGDGLISAAEALRRE